jgi:hypothetical protein
MDFWLELYVQALESEEENACCYPCQIALEISK